MAIRNPAIHNSAIAMGRGVPVGQVPRAAPAPISEKQFLILVYFGNALLRILIGGAIVYLGFVSFLAGDHWTYDFYGWGLSQAWKGRLLRTSWVYEKLNDIGNNGMYYFVASIYWVFGHNQFIALVIEILITAFTPVVVYKIALQIYGSQQVARYSALATAFLPTMLIFGCLLLKDPLIILLVCITVLCTLRLQKQMNLTYILGACGAMILVFTLRGYVFYFLFIAIVAALILSRSGRKVPMGVFVGRIVALGVLLLVLFGAGFNRIAQRQLSQNILERIQLSRLDLARSAQSGFATEANVSTIGGALRFLPKGMLYLFFAPFPWEAGGSFRHLMMMPEMLLWYIAFPYFLAGIGYTLKRHLRDALVIVLFVAQLTLFYGVFIGNVGTAVRLRMQVFIFYLVFTLVGWVYSRRKRAGISGSIADKGPVPIRRSP